MEKVCKITNSTYQYKLEVDDVFICFSGSWGADYFEKHYSELGYKVERVNLYK